MATNEPAKKSRPKTLPSHLTPGNPGNSGGKRGRSGRKPNAFKAFLGELRKSPEFQQAIEDAATDPTSRGFSAALKLVTDYDDEKPAEKKELSGKVEVRVRIEREGRRVTAG